MSEEREKLPSCKQKIRGGEVTWPRQGHESAETDSQVTVTSSLIEHEAQGVGGGRGHTASSEPVKERKEKVHPCGKQYVDSSNS